MRLLRRFAAWYPSPRRTIAATAVLLLAVVLSAVAPSGGRATAADTPNPMTLKGEGTYGPYQEIVTWQDDLYGAKQPVDLAYTATGSYQGRQDYALGNLDYVISGRPFSKEELDGTKVAKAGIIDVPIQVEAMAMLLAVPLPEGFVSINLVCDPYDPDTPDPEACIVRTPYAGDIKVPSRNLAAMLLRYAGTGALPLSSWNDPDVLDAMGVQNFTLDPLAGPAPVMRSDPSATNYYLQQFVKTVAPDVWEGVQQADDRITWEPITERLPRAGASRQGVEQQSLQLGLGGADPASGTVTGFSKGIFAPVPPSAKGEVASTFPSTQLTFIQVQNKGGEWTAPTPDSISKAVEAGGDEPLYALTHEAAGAYPLVWVNHLYAPASGLSVEKTEALAATIRYLATAGQDAAAPVGEGKLSAALAAKALAGADDLVTGNCKGADRKLVTSSDPGPYAPDLPALKAIGPMKHCQAVAGTTTTTSTTTTIAGTIPADTTPITYPTDAGTTDLGTDFGIDAGTTDTTPVDTDSSAGSGEGGATTTTAAPTTTTTAPLDAQLAAATLPLPLPTGASSGYDRLAALLLGAALYLAFGPVVRKVFVRIRG